jgi:ribonuclease HIII
MTAPFVVNIDLQLVDKLRQLLEEQGFALTTAPHAIFSAKKRGVSCTLYESGKLVVQGKEMAPFIEFYLEPEILGHFAFTHQTALLDLMPRIGSDEAGKGDFFGPLCVAGLFAEGKDIERLVTMGVRDSKSLSDKKIISLAAQLQRDYAHHIIRITPTKYNELYPKFRNLNFMLAWAHAAVLQDLRERTQCPLAIIDKFADESVLERALERKGVIIQAQQKTKAESDPVVAGASILARAAFVQGIDKLGEEFHITLPKGANSEVYRVGKLLVAKHGPEILSHVAKTHFKTYREILGLSPE